jgi:enoyl-CoA hydratase/carnithine racemase
MTDTPTYREIGVSRDGLVATVEMRRPPHNFFDSALIAEIGDAPKYTAVHRGPSGA